MLKALMQASLIAAAVIGCSNSIAQGAADGYRSRAITLIVPFSPGGVADATARLLAQKLQESWHQSVVVENRTGGGGAIGATAAARAPADGYTYLLGVSALVLQPQLVEKPAYDPFKDFTPITLIARLPVLLTVPATSQAKTLEEFMALCKTDASSMSMGNYGIGTSSHLLGIMLGRQAGVDLVQVPYQGSTPLISALLGGQLGAAFVDSATVRPYAGKLRFLAVTGNHRLPGLPNLPTFTERGLKSLDHDGWIGVLVPAKTPREIADKLTNELSRIMAMPDVASKIEGLGIAPVGSTPAEFAKVMRTDSDDYGKVIREAGLRLN
jgi:tripartite-type tricarboxylate transporter receptor subunit TctC